MPFCSHRKKKKRQLSLNATMPSEPVIEIIQLRRFEQGAHWRRATFSSVRLLVGVAKLPEIYRWIHLEEFMQSFSGSNALLEIHCQSFMCRDFVRFVEWDRPPVGGLLSGSSVHLPRTLECVSLLCGGPSRSLTCSAAVGCLLFGISGCAACGRALAVSGNDGRHVPPPKPTPPTTSFQAGPTSLRLIDISPSYHSLSQVVGNPAAPSEAAGRRARTASRTP